MRGFIKDGIYFKHEKEKGKLVKFDAWSINLLETGGKPIKKVCFETEKYRYWIDYKEAVENGFRKVFKDEPKLIVPIKYWKKEEL